MSNTSNPPELMVAHEVAALLRIEVATVYAAAATGKLPAVRIWRGRRKSLLRFRRTDIEALLTRPITTEVTSARTPSAPGRTP